MTILFCLIGCIVSNAQMVLKGRITASDSNKPIIAANVFLSNTSVGTLSNENGEFTISPFPSGRFDLVISYIGYETYIINVLSNELPQSLPVVLKPKVMELKEVIVESFEKNGWEKWGSLFIENFIGTSSFANECKLVNKDAVRFRFNKKGNTLNAYADESLLLENKALGYLLKYELIKFEYNFTERILFYQGYPHFEDIETDKKSKQRRWNRNREEAYYGSLMHFMRSLFRNKLIENGFEVRKLYMVTPAEKNRVKAIYQSGMKGASSNGTFVIGQSFPKIDNTDSIAYYRKVLQHPEELSVLVNTVLPGDSIAYGIDSVTAALEFTNYLQVRFPSKLFPEEYGKPGFRTATKGPITSMIHLISGKPVAVLANGSYFSGIDLISSGYWGWWEKMATMLPFDYKSALKK